MEIKVTKTSMEILRKQYKHLHLSEDQVTMFVNVSWDNANTHGKIIFDATSTAAIFCLSAESYAHKAVFIHLSKHPVKGIWNAYHIYYRTPLIPHPVADNDPFTNHLFGRFPGLEASIEDFSDMRLLAWTPPVITSLIGPDPSALLDIIKECVEESFDDYSTRIYEPMAFGFSRKVQVDIIVDRLIEIYESERKANRVFSVDPYYGCATSMTNAVGDSLYLIICADDDFYVKACSYDDIEGTFHGDAAKLQHEVSLLTVQPPKRKNALWRFAKFNFNEYADLYNGEGIAKNVRLLNEVWSYDTPGDADSEARCLGKYIEGTFLRVLFEHKLWILDGNKRKTDDPDKKCYAVFNTGLVDISYRPVYMIFRWDNTKWIVDSFRTVGNGLLNGKDESECPPKADYIGKNILNTMYCTDDAIVSNWRTPKISDDHVFENFSRLPETVQRYCLGDSYDDYRRTNDVAIVTAMPNEKRMRIFRAFKEAIRVAISRAAWNMRTGVPVYYYNDGTVSILLPLCMQQALDYELGNVDSVDATSACDTAALMVMTQDTSVDGAIKLKYECKTLFSLSMAYRDARLINRPESDWLVPQ